MRYYPILLDLKGKECVVVGGGSVAQRKVYALLKAGARVKVISPKLTKGLRELKKKKKIACLSSTYTKGSLQDAFLVIAATNSQVTNKQVALDAASRGSLINVVDASVLSNFIVPSVIAKKDLIISISTSGKAPCLSKRIRKDLEKLLVPEYAIFLSRLKEIRGNIKLRCLNAKQKAQVLHSLVEAKV
ncbi:MAG: hypothetical protein A2Y00_05020 [Omnitrophica WOR_2 bacterium GWF2_43_52]|nr:MAG: hypothetical protein A2062_02475 [Omnitrophica WOR_2 bacterium GWA2_44_7]OGX17531.1 MAG: hypothetical protein A2Y01_01850 [Omnitrophica WOR_2 bacterium GWC2_44_8]OGX20469.1 MAG: hypothetical protein A2Y00_05020 [Omnitrophica WOR_2 bacterium GWF2_43_52]OGX58286.1 MAG: hypothetical protein A2460_06010 [Omnitrophica WOR_2 bacterium RIFOXYC2_FULL_43_9]HAH20523.1 siroheme synthase [Candidatus Omnitrophota bacterium]